MFAFISGARASRTALISRRNRTSKQLAGLTTTSKHIRAVDRRTVFEHACTLGLEGIVSKRRDKPYRHGRCREWLKIKNPASAAMTRVWEDRF